MDDSVWTDGHPPARVGERLAAARKKAKLDLDDVAERTRIPMRHLQAIEASDHNQLPAATYSAGFVKTYANLLGLDGTALAQDFRAELGEYRHGVRDSTAFEPVDPSRVPSRLLVTIALIAAVVFAILYGLWRGGMSHEQVTQLAAGTAPDAPPAQVAPVPPKPVTPSSSAPAAAGGAVVLAATDTVWIKVTDPGKPTLFMGVLNAGQSYTVPADAADPRLLTSRPQVLHITVGNTAIPPLGKPEQVVRDVSLKPASLAQFAATANAEAPPAPAPNASSQAPVDPAAGAGGATPAPQP